MVNSIEELRDLYPFESHYFHLKNGYRYHYIDEGKGDDIIVMVHGNPSWSFLFRKIIKGLRDNYRIIAPDHIGFGLSDKPNDYSYRLESHIDNLDEFLESFQFEKVTLLMHDWGGPIAMGYAERYPEKIQRLIITNTAVFTVDKIPLRLKLCRIPLIGSYLVKNLNLFVKLAMSMTTVKPLDKRVQNGYLLPFKNPNSRTGILRFVEDIPILPEHESYELLVRLEHCLWVFRERPICIIWGMKDWCFTRYFYKRWLEYYPEADPYPLQDAAHFLFEDQPEKIISIISNFMSKKLSSENKTLY